MRIHSLKAISFSITPHSGGLICSVEKGSEEFIWKCRNGRIIKAIGAKLFRDILVLPMQVTTEHVVSALVEVIFTLCSNLASAIPDSVKGQQNWFFFQLKLSYLIFSLAEKSWIVCGVVNDLDCFGAVPVHGNCDGGGCDCSVHF